MFYYKFTALASFCGTENTYYEKFEYQPEEKELDEMAEEYCRENAESFEYLVTGWDDDNFDSEEEREQALESYREDCSCKWEEISEKEYEENT